MRERQREFQDDCGVRSQIIHHHKPREEIVQIQSRSEGSRKDFKIKNMIKQLMYLNILGGDLNCGELGQKTRQRNKNQYLLILEGKINLYMKRKSNNVLKGSVMNTTDTVLTMQTLNIVLTKLYQEKGRTRRTCVCESSLGWVGCNLG